MFVPAMEKQWQFVLINREDVQSPSTSIQFIYYKIIETITGFASGSWVVDYSCNGTTAGIPGDGVNRILGESDVLIASEGSNHSWIVLRQPGLSASFQMMIDFTRNNSYIRFTWDQPFLGGSATNSPQSSTQKDFASFNVPQMNSSEANQRYYIMQSTDGECMRILCERAGTTSTSEFGLCVEKIQNHGSLHLNPFFLKLDSSEFVVDLNGDIKSVDYAYDVISTSDDSFCTTNFWGGEHRYVYKKPLIIEDRDHVVGSLYDVGVGRLENKADVKLYRDESDGIWLQLGHYIYPWDPNIPYL